MLDATKWWGRLRRPETPIEEIRAFHAVFSAPLARQYVLPVLAEYCGAAYPMPSDPVAMQRAAGRLDVWLQIRHRLDLTDNDLYALLQGAGPTRR